MLKNTITTKRGSDAWIPRWYNTCGNNPSVNQIIDDINANALAINNPSGAGGEILYRDPSTLNLVELSAIGQGGKWLQVDPSSRIPAWNPLPAQTGGSGGGQTLFVAANNALASIKARADYICTGTNDNVQIQAAINALTNGGTVILSDGTFTISATILVDAHNITIQGQGNNATFITTTSTTINGLQLGNRQTSGIMRNNMRLIGLTINLPNASAQTPLYVNGMGEGGYIQNVSVKQGGRAAILKDLDRCLIIDLEAFNPNIAGIACQTGLENTWGTVTFINCSTVLSNSNTIGWKWETASEQTNPNKFDRVKIIGSLFFQTGSLTGCIGMQMDVGCSAFDVDTCLFEQNLTHFRSNADCQITFHNCTFLNAVTNSTDTLYLNSSGKYSVYDCRFQQSVNVFNGVSGYPTVYVGGLNNNQGNLTNMWVGSFGQKSGTDVMFAGPGILANGFDDHQYDATWQNKSGFVELATTPAPDTHGGLLYLKTDHNPYVLTPQGTENQLQIVSGGTPAPNNPPGPLPSGGTGGTGGNTNPPAQNSTYQDGQVALYSQHSLLADFNSTSPVASGSESVVSLANASPDGTDNAFKFTVVSTTNNEIGLDKDLSGSKVRVFRFDFKLDSAATLTNESTIFHAWSENYKNDLVQIRIAPRSLNGNTDFVFALYCEDPTTGKIPSGKNFLYSFDHFQRNTYYSLELYMTDYGFQLRAAPYGSTLKTIIDFFAYNYATFGPIWKGMNMGGIALSKFYSQSLAGIYYIHAPKFLADYIYPTFPTSLSTQITNGWDAWKRRYIRTDGLTRRPSPQGSTGTGALSSDNVSEATGYSLLLAVEMNDQVTFDLVYAYDKAHLQRSNGSGLTATHLSGWHYNDEAGTMYDWNFASDGEIDKALALVFAAKRAANGDTGWAASSINYATEANAVLSDLKTYAFRTISGKAYQVSDAFQGSASNIETNPSYISVAAYKAFKTFTSDTFWDTAVTGGYDYFTKDAGATMTNPPSARLDNGTTDPNNSKVMVGVGLSSEWAGLNSSTGALQTPPNNRDIYWGWNAFRTQYRIYWDLMWYSEPQAKTILTGSIRQTFINIWTKYSLIWAVNYYDGTPRSTYEKSMMSMAAYFTLIASASNDSTAAAIWSGKLANIYTQNPGGDYFGDTPTGGIPTYFGDAWNLIGMMMKNGTFINFVLNP